jgi:hypothetical protein
VPESFVSQGLAIIAITERDSHKIDAQKPHSAWECSTFHDSILTQSIYARNLRSKRALLRKEFVLRKATAAIRQLSVDGS